MNQKLLPIGKTAKIVGVSIQTLRRWDTAGRLSPFRLTPKSKRYYRIEDIEAFMNSDISSLAEKWVKNEQATVPGKDFYCPTSDIFQGRLPKIVNELSNLGIDKNLLSLIVAVVGEIGNNSYDHNIGVWPDASGIFFGYDLKRRAIVLADRGQGVFKTLSRVKPTLKNDKEAVRIAFTEIITGRAPEERGNGLKLVKNVVMANPLTLLFQSGNAELSLKQNDKDLKIRKVPHGFRGCMAIINF